MLQLPGQLNRVGTIIVGSQEFKLILSCCRELEGWLDCADELATAARAVICPHAGYRYSGPTAAHSFKQIDPTSVRLMPIQNAGIYIMQNTMVGGWGDILYSSREKMKKRGEREKIRQKEKKPHENFPHCGCKMIFLGEGRGGGE